MIDRSGALHARNRGDLCLQPAGSGDARWRISDDVAPELHPGRMHAPHAVTPQGIASVTLGADPEELSAWLGGAALPVRLGGPPGVNVVTVATGAGEMTIP